MIKERIKMLHRISQETCLGLTNCTGCPLESYKKEDALDRQTFKVYMCMMSSKINAGKELSKYTEEKIFEVLL